MTLRLDADGRPIGSPRAIRRMGELRFLVSAAVDLDGNAVVAGLRFVRDRRRCCSQAWAALVPRRGPAGPAQPLSEAGVNVADVWRLAIGAGRAVAAWEGYFGLSMAATTAGRFAAPRPILDDGRSISDALVRPDGTVEVLALDAGGQLQQVTWPRDEPAVVRPINEIRPAPGADAPYVVSGLDGTRVLAQTGVAAPGVAAPISARIARPDGHWSPATAIGPLNPLIGVGPHGDAAVVDTLDGRLRVRWRDGGSFAPPRPTRLRPRGMQGVVVGDGVAAVSWATPERRPAVTVAMLRRNGPARTHRIRLASWSSPSLAVGTHGIVVAAQTPRGLEILRFPRG